MYPETELGDNPLFYPGLEEQYLKEISDKVFLCLVCNKRVPRKDNAKRHIRLVHFPALEDGCRVCHLCQKTYKNQLVLDDHCRRSHGIYKSVQPSDRQ